MKKLILLLVAGSFLVSCSSSDKKVEETTSATPTSSSCIYAFDQENTVLKWTAYKTTEKIGVSGQFSEYTVLDTKEAATVYEAVSGAKVLIPIKTVATGDAGRDSRIVQYFFGTFTETDTIKVTVKEITAEGKGVFSIKMNGIEKDVPFAGEISGSLVKAEAVLDLAQFDGQNAVDALNKACDGLHKGADGITKLWPDVKIEITARMKETCN